VSWRAGDLCRSNLTLERREGFASQKLLAMALGAGPVEAGCAASKDTAYNVRGGDRDDLRIFQGSWIVNVVPCPGWLATPMVPPCASTSVLAIESPSPMPLESLPL
jgi:hypothetical protein